MFYLTEMCRICLKTDCDLRTSNETDINGVTSEQKLMACFPDYDWNFCNYKICAGCQQSLGSVYAFRRAVIQSEETYRKYVTKLMNVEPSNTVRLPDSDEVSIRLDRFQPTSVVDLPRSVGVQEVEEYFITNEIIYSDDINTYEVDVETENDLFVEEVLITPDGIKTERQDDVVVVGGEKTVDNDRPIDCFDVPVMTVGCLSMEDRLDSIMKAYCDGTKDVEDFYSTGEDVAIEVVSLPDATTSPDRSQRESCESPIQFLGFTTQEIGERKETTFLIPIETETSSDAAGVDDDQTTTTTSVACEERRENETTDHRRQHAKHHRNKATSGPSAATAPCCLNHKFRHCMSAFLRNLNLTASKAEAASDEENNDENAVEDDVDDQEQKVLEQTRPFHCDQCSRCFSFRSNLLAHVNVVHNGVRRYCCTLCNKMYGKRSNLDQHMRMHTGARPYTCDQCEKSYTTKNILLTHIRRHRGDKQHECEYCFKRFVTKMELARHTRIHTGVKPYKCTHCLKTFTTNTELVNHVRVHTGEKPYRCKFCEKTFPRLGALITHHRRHNNERRYLCPLCPTAYITNHELQRHTKNCHK